MRILQVSHTSWTEHRGGVETHLRELLPRLVRRGHEVVYVHGAHVPERQVVVLDRGEIQVGDGAADTSTDPVPSGLDPRGAADASSGARPEPRSPRPRAIRRFEIRRDDAYFELFARGHHGGVSRAFAELLDRVRPDLVHVHHWVNLSNDLVATAVRRGIPCAVTLHDAWTTCPRAFRVHRDGSACGRTLSVASCAPCVPLFGHEGGDEIAASIELHRDRLRAELRAASAVFVSSRALADLVEETTGGAGPRFVVTPLAPLPVPAAAPRPRAAVSERPVRFGWWGVGAPHKGLGDVLAAYAELVGGGGIDAELHVFGPIPDHALAADLEARAHALPGIHRHGPFAFEDLERADLDVAVLPSRAFETWGLSLDEAVALDLPAIVSAVGAPAARLGDGVATVPPGDIPALVRAMRALATDAALGLDQLAARRELVRRLPAAPPLDAVLADTYERVVREGVALAPGMLAELDELDRRSAALDELQRASLGRHDGPLGSPR